MFKQRIEEAVRSMLVKVVGVGITCSVGIWLLSLIHPTMAIFFTVTLARLCVYLEAIIVNLFEAKNPIRN